MKYRLLPMLFLALVPGLAQALGLGNLRLESALNEPLSARIELVAATAEELASLHVDLADEEAFQRAGVERHYHLKQLRFSVKESEAGPDYILVTSDEPIREPFLNFLVEINWSKGRLYREYTVLLDPPLYVAEEIRKAVTPPSVSAPKPGVTAVTPKEEHTVVYHPEYTPAPQREVPPSRTVTYEGGDYGPVVSGDTLWSIARAMRPDSSVSIQQMMLALLRANPEAFINSNINGLKRGYVLKAPDLSEARSLGKDEAFAQAQLQNNLWEEARGAVVEAPPVRPEGAPAQPEPVVTEEPAAPTVAAEETAPPVTAESQPELRLVAPAEEGETAGQGGVAEPGEQELNKELALVTETLEALTQENAELKGKIAESDAILGDLNRLITLKQDELAALQQQVAAKEAEAKAKAQAAEAAAREKPKPEQVAAAPAGTKAPPPAKQPAAKAKETAKAPAPAGQVKGETGTDFMSSIIAAGAGVMDLIRNYFIYIAGALGVLLVVFVGTYYYQRRQAAAEVAPGVFADFSEEPTVASVSEEDITDMNVAEAAEPEAITILPGQVPETTQVAAAPATGGEGMVVEADPLEEVNVFLAYEHFNQAEDFVKKALEKEPDNLAYHSKLLEVYYTANNKKAYEQAARVMHDKTQGKGDYWNMALAMWQVMSPKRELFAAPAAGEEPAEPAAAKEAGGIVNITGEGEAATGTGLDLDLDTTGGGAETAGDTLEVETAEAEADVLDVTAAITTADNEVLDVTAAVDTTGGGQAAEEEVVATAADEGALDFSLDFGEEKEAEEAESLESSLDLLKPEEETTASPAKNLEEEDLEMSLEMEGPAEAEEPVEIEASALDLDMSLDSGAEPAMEESHTGSSLLDITSSVDTGIDENDLSSTGAALLDVTSAQSVDEGEAGAGQEAAAAGSEEMAEPQPMAGQDQGGDMLDVTAATDFDLETGKDLLDLTSAGSLADTEKADEGALDFELAPDQPASGGESAFESIDLTAATGTPAAGLELELELSPESAEEAFEMDMDSTMQIPTKRSTLSGTAEEDVTFKVSRSTGGAQSDEDEIATQLDLAKAYIELGNADSAKTILGEIIAVGNAEQRQQAQELLGQLA